MKKEFAMSKYYFFENDNNKDFIDELPSLPSEGASFEAWKKYMELMEAIASSWEIPPKIFNPKERGELDN